MFKYLKATTYTHTCTHIYKTVDREMWEKENAVNTIKGRTRKEVLTALHFHAELNAHVFLQYVRIYF